MSLNVKDPEAHRLAQAIAQATGQSMTRVVTEALRERFARIERQKSKASVAELLTIAERAATHVQRPYVPHSELFYEDTGDRKRVVEGKSGVGRVVIWWSCAFKKKKTTQ